MGGCAGFSILYYICKALPSRVWSYFSGPKLKREGTLHLHIERKRRRREQQVHPKGYQQQQQQRRRYFKRKYAVLNTRWRRYSILFITAACAAISPFLLRLFICLFLSSLQGTTQSYRRWKWRRSIRRCCSWILGRRSASSCPTRTLAPFSLASAVRSNQTHSLTSLTYLLQCPPPESRQRVVWSCAVQLL